MKTLFVAFLSVFSVSAMAIEPGAIEKESLRQKAECDKQFAGTSSTNILARTGCKLGVDIAILERKQKDGDARVAAELAQGRAQFDAIGKSIKALEEAAKAQAEAAKVATKPLEQPSAQAASVQQTPAAPVMFGAPFAVVDVQGNYGATTFEVPQNPFRAEIYEISSGGIKWFQRSGSQRVVVFKNGHPLAVVHPGNTVNTFYADLDGDGKPDLNPYNGFDPNCVDTIYVGHQSGDQITLVYLVPTGKMVAFSGAPPQMIWGGAKRNVFSDNSVGRDQYGRPTISARIGSPML